MSGVNLKFKSELNGALTLETIDGSTMVSIRPDGTVCISSLAPIQISGVKHNLVEKLLAAGSVPGAAENVLAVLNRDLRKAK